MPTTSGTPGNYTHYTRSRSHVIWGPMPEGEAQRLIRELGHTPIPGPTHP